MKLLLQPRLRLVLFFLFYFLNGLVSQSQVSQQWAARYNGSANRGDAGNAVAIDASGNIYVTGSSSEINSDLDITIIKYNNAGIQQWIKHYNGPANSSDVGNAIAVDYKGDVYVTGFSIGIGTDRDYTTIKYSGDGNEQWVRRYNGPKNYYDEANDIVLDNAGNVYITGQSFGRTSSYDYVTIKYSENGDEVWLKRYNGTGNGNDIARDMGIDQLGNIYITGSSWGVGTRVDYCTIKYAPDGTQLWETRYNSARNRGDQANALAIDKWGNCIVTGLTSSTNYLNEWLTVKYNPAGEELWKRSYNRGPTSYNEPRDLAVDDNGNVFVTGRASLNGIADLVTIKYNAEGITQWENIHNGPGVSYDAAGSVAVDADGAVYVVGTSTSDHLFGGQVITTLKYNAPGELKWMQQYDSPSSDESGLAADIVVDASKNVYVTGTSFTHQTGLDIFTIKYSQAPPLAVNAGKDTTILLGLTTSCVSLTAVPTGGTGQYTYNWSGVNNIGQTLTVCPAVTTTYTVTVTDALNNKATDAVTVTVIDLRCGNNDDKISVCHKGKTLCISKSALAAHLKHGDKLGKCSNDPLSAAAASKPEVSIPRNYKTYNFPNPFVASTKIFYELPNDSKVIISVYDGAGRLVENLVNADRKAGRYIVDYTLRSGKGGMYYYTFEARSGKQTFKSTQKMAIVQ